MMSASRPAKYREWAARISDTSPRADDFDVALQELLTATG
jgi:hypothetical protein